jgi:hypothetical protein
MSFQDHSLKQYGNIDRGRSPEASVWPNSTPKRAFATDPDPTGSNIRSAPRPSAAVIGHLPPRQSLGGDDYASAEFDVIGSKDGWLLIQNARAATKGAEVQIFVGPGWISGGLAGVLLGSPALRAEPRQNAATRVRLTNETKNWGPNSYRVARIHGCFGEFIEATTTPPLGPAVRGWSYRPCASQLTTCDRGVE